MLCCHFREFLFAALLKLRGIRPEGALAFDFREFLFAALLKPFLSGDMSGLFDLFPRISIRGFIEAFYETGAAPRKGWISANFYSRLY